MKQLKNYQDKEAQQKLLQTTIYVLNQDVKSGQIITSDMLQPKQVYTTMIPNNAIGDVTTLDNYSLQDKEGNTVSTKTENGKTTLHITNEGREYELKQEDTLGTSGEVNYYIEKNGEKQYIELNTIPVLAKVAMQANTILTRETITKGNNTTADDVRKQEYNMIVLPTQIQTGDYIDIRLSMPTGEDYIVVSKKEVTVPMVGDTDSEDTIWVNLTEEEILTMNSAIMDAFRVDGSKLYATTYTEPGIQSAASPTYVINSEVIQLIISNPNIINEVKNALNARYSANNLSAQRDRINQNLQNNLETSDENLKAKVEESIQKTQEQRQKYLQDLESAATATTTNTTTE